MLKTLQELAQLVGGKVLGDTNPQIAGVTNIEDAGATEITFAVPPPSRKGCGFNCWSRDHS